MCTLQITKDWIQNYFKQINENNEELLEIEIVRSKGREKQFSSIVYSTE